MPAFKPCIKYSTAPPATAAGLLFLKTFERLSSEKYCCIVGKLPPFFLHYLCRNLITQQDFNKSQTISFPGVMDTGKAMKKEVSPITYFNLFAVLRGSSSISERSLADILVAKIDNALSITILAIGPQRDIPSLDYVHSAIGHLMQLGENHQFTYANCNITDANGNPIFSDDQLSHSQL